MANDLIRKGHKIIVVAGGTNGVDLEDWNPAIQLVPIQLDPNRFRVIEDSKIIWNLLRLIRRLKPDIIHCFTIKPILYGGIAFALSRPWSKSKKLVWTFAGLGKALLNNANRKETFRRSIALTFLTLISKFFGPIATFENSADRDELVTSGVIPIERSHVLMGTGIDLEKFCPPCISKNEQAPMVFMAATRLIHEKGVDLYLETAARLKDRGFEHRFQLAGLWQDDNPDAVSRDSVQTAVARGDIEFLGELSQKHMADALRKVDVFCLPTRLREGFPRSLIEAAASGVALIASDQPSTRILVPPGKQTGWLIDPFVPNSLEEAITEAAQFSQETRAMGKRAGNLVRSLPISADDIATCMDLIYQD